MILSDGGSSCDTPPRKSPSSRATSSQSKRHSLVEIPIGKMKSVEPDLISSECSSVPVIRKMTPTKTRTISKSNHSTSSASSVRSVPLNDINYQNRSSISEVSSGLNAFEEETLSKWNNEIDDLEAPPTQSMLPKFDHLESLKSNNFVTNSIVDNVKNIELTPSRPVQPRRVGIYSFRRILK